MPNVVAHLQKHDPAVPGLPGVTDSLLTLWANIVRDDVKWGQPVSINVVQAFHNTFTSTGEQAQVEQARQHAEHSYNVSVPYAVRALMYNLI